MEPTPQALPALRERDRRILDELSGPDTRVGFQALRRRLGVHPQILTRALASLVANGQIQRVPDGYRLTPGQDHSLPTNMPAPTHVPVLLALLPNHLEPKTVADRLARRWFKGLRWHGRSDDGREIQLVWDAPALARSVRVRLVGGVAALESEASADGRTADVAALQPLVEALAEFYNGGGAVALSRTDWPSLAA